MLKQLQTKSAKGVISIFSSGIISKGFWAVCGLFLSKYYGPENFGIYNVFLGYLGILSVIATFRLEHILVITKSPRQIVNFYHFLLNLSVAGTILTLLISYFLWVISFERRDGLTLSVWGLIGLGSLFSSWVLIQNAFFTKFRFFNAISVGLIINTAFAITFQSIFYFIFPAEVGFYGLILGYIFGLLASIIYYLKIARTKSPKFDWKSSKELIKSNKNILKYAFPSESINTLANNLFIILAAIYFGQIEVGVFALALKILSTPMVLIFNAFSKVYFQKAAQMFYSSKEKLMSLAVKVSLYSGCLNLLFLALMNTIGIYLLQMFYKPENWPELSVYMLSISFWIFARSIVSPISQITIVINKNQLSLWMNLGLLLSNFTGIIAGIIYKNFKTAILVFSVSAGIIYLLFYIIVLIYLRKYITNNDYQPS